MFFEVSSAEIFYIKCALFSSHPSIRPVTQQQRPGVLLSASGILTYLSG